MRIGIASDHAGFDVKETLKNYLSKASHATRDFGTNGKTSVDYPNYAAALCCSLQRGDIDWGILICGSGIGMSIAANRFHNIRAALCHSPEDVTLARKHNDANVLVLGARTSQKMDWEAMLKMFLEAPFEGGRHKKRLEKIDQLPHCDIKSDHEDLYD